MNYIKQDLNRLIKYGQGLGLKISIKPYVRGSGDAGYWYTDGSEVTLFQWPRQSTTSLVLICLHELAHHLSYRYAGDQLNKKYLEALDADYKRNPDDKPIKKSLRKAIYLKELNDTKFQDAIAFETGLRIPKWKIDAEKELDIWIYHVYYITGQYPNKTEKMLKRKELIKKYEKS